MPFDTLIRGAEVVLPYGGGQRRIDLAITDGRIAAHLDPGAEAEANETIDATGRVILPGVIDPHTHLNLGDPETAFETETRAAALHGITTILHFLMSNDPYEAEYNGNTASGATPKASSTTASTPSSPPANSWRRDRPIRR